MGILKRIVIALAIVSIPLIWVFMIRGRLDFPTPPVDMTRTPVAGRQVVIETNRGKIVAVLYEEDAKKTCRNFVSLVQRKFYDGLVFHRVEPVVIQTGDPTGTGRGGSGKTIPLEVTPLLLHDAPGVLGMARTEDPHSASSQFYIALRPMEQWDGQYAVFGRVISGMDVVNKIKKGDKMTRVYLQPAGATKAEAPRP